MRIVLDEQRTNVSWNQRLRRCVAGASQNAGFAAYLAAQYWRLSRRPLVSLAFILPLVLLYESGSWLAQEHLPRNGAEVWMRSALASVGLRHWLVLPLLAVLILAAWHRISRRPWKLSGALLGGMAIECGTWAVLLLLVAQSTTLRIDRQMRHPTVTATGAPTALDELGALERLAALAGAGVYEEMLFRLVMLPLAMLAVLRLSGSLAISRAAAVAVSSLVFAAAHQWGGGYETFFVSEFLFRTLAGMMLALLFLRRGFGIAAGTHAMYDILASSL